MRITVLRALKLFVFCFFCLLTYFSNTRIRASNPKFAVRDTFFDTLRIETIEKETHVAFAMIDARRGNMGKPSVRLLTITTADRPQFHCKFENGDIVLGSFYEFSENHMQHFGTYYLSCAIPSMQHLNFRSIEVSKNITAGWHSVPISYKIPDVLSFENYRTTYSICVPKLFGDSFTAERFVEFVELNRLFGVESITLYVDKQNISAKLNQTFDFYGNEGILSVRDVRLPFNENMIWYHAQLLTITDCLVRHTGKSRFVAFHDLDEFLVPLKTRFVPDYLEQTLTGNVSSLRVKTSYIFLEYCLLYDLVITIVSCREDRAPITTRNLKTQSSLDGRLTKCVLRPEHVFEQGIHHTSRVIQDYMNATTGADDDLRLFHFKTHRGSIENKYLAATYGQELQKNFDEVVTLLKL